MVTYTVRDETDIMGPAILRQNADGSISTIPIDLGNADYQAYLNKDNPDYGNKL